MKYQFSVDRKLNHRAILLPILEKITKNRWRKHISKTEVGKIADKPSA